MGEGPAVSSLLQQIMPEYDVSSSHQIAVEASPPEVYRVARQADLGRPPLVRLLMGLRVIPVLIAAGGRRRAGLREAENGQHAVGGARFTLVAEAPGEEFVLGLMGRFWTLSGGLIQATADELRRPPPAGIVQALWNFRVEPNGSGSRLWTETRVRCADEATRTRFLRYWRVIRPGSALIRRSILRSIRARTEAQ